MNSKRIGQHTSNLGGAGQEEFGEQQGNLKEFREKKIQQGSPKRFWRNSLEVRTGEFKTDRLAYLKSEGRGSGRVWRNSFGTRKSLEKHPGGPGRVWRNSQEARRPGHANSKPIGQHT